MKNKLLSEFIGTFFLLATVVGSGIMAENLAGGNIALALLGNTIPTGAILAILIMSFGPVSGAHFNPAVTFAFWLRKEIDTKTALTYVPVQIIAAVAGVVAAHLMFETDVISLSEKQRTGSGIWISEVIATFGLVMTILGCLRHFPAQIGYAVGLYISAAYWFTASTSFANPAVTIARSLSNTFSGITPEHVPLFIVMQLLGAVLAVITMKTVLDKN